MKKMFLALAVLLMSSQSFATGGTYCSGENKDVKVIISTTTGRAFGAPIVQLISNVEFKKQSLVQDVTGMEFSKDDIAGYWMLDGNTKLAVSHSAGTDDFSATVEMVLEAKRKADGELAGVVSIVKRINNVRGDQAEEKFKVKVSCESDEG